MPVWICRTCGNHYAEAVEPPSSCVLCADERQWVPQEGQRWATMAQLAEEGYRTEVREVEPGMWGVGVAPELGVRQRGLLVTTSAGNILWDPPGFLDEAAVRKVAELGGVAAVSSSHPHMYGACVDWSHAFDAPILFPKEGLRWFHRTDSAIQTWSGSCSPLPGVVLAQCGGHFASSAVLHWADGAAGRGALLVGDSVYVTPGQDRITFLWSPANGLPMPERMVRQVVAAMEPYDFDRVYSAWWNRVVRADGHKILRTSAERYIQFLNDEAVVCD